MHEANNPPNLCSGCVFWIKPTHRFSLGLGQSPDPCSMSSPCGFKMFENHWKLMVAKVNLLVSIASVNSKLLYSTVYSQCVLSPWRAVNPPLWWISRHGLLYLPCAHIQVCSCTLVLQFKWDFQPKPVSELSQLFSITLREDIPSSIWCLLHLHSHYLHSSLDNFGGYWFLCGFYCGCFAFVFVLLLMLFVFVVNIHIELTMRQTLF